MLLSWSLLACSGEPLAQPDPDAVADVVGEDPANEPPAMDAEALSGAAKEATLVPSPTEMQRALQEAGLKKGLSKLVPPHAAPKAGDDKDQVAVRVGMDLAYTLLTVEDAETPALVERLNQVKSGMSALGAGTDIGATVDDLVGRLQSDSLSRGDLLSELDEMHGAVLPEIEFEAGERVVPLIQAGSWLAGVNLISTAALDAKKPEAAQLLRQPEVARHFLQYVRTEGADKASAVVMKELENTLSGLGELASKEKLDKADVERIQKSTGDVLALL